MRLAAFCILLSIAGRCESTSRPPRKTVWSGVYTSRQAERGASVYRAQCSQCHKEDLSGYSGLRGEKFRENWREDNLSSLWTRISRTMPLREPGTLKEDEYLDILAYILQANDFPAGSREIKTADLNSIRFEEKEGPGPVPDFALVQTTGCLARDGDGIWRVKRASEPVRTRNPNASSASELESAGAQPSGNHTFRLLDGSGVKDDLNGRKVQVKGFLIRKPDEDRLNATMVEPAGPACR